MEFDNFVSSQEYEAIAKLIQEAEYRANRAGVPTEIVKAVLIRAEAEFTAALADKNRKLLEHIRSAGTNAVAERLGKSKSQVRRYRARLLKTRIKGVFDARSK